MEITLTVDDELLAQLRASAELRQTTLDEMIVEQLRKVCEADKEIDEWVRWTRENAGRSEPGWRFNRDEIYDRPILK